MAASGGVCRRLWSWGRALQISITILLSLFLPLSFLLLARLSSAVHSRFSYHYFRGGFNGDVLGFLFLYFNSALLYLLLSFFSVAAFVRRLTGGRVALIRMLLCYGTAKVDDPVGSRRRPRLSVGWLLLCSSLMFAELGIEFQLSVDQRPSFSDYHPNKSFSILRGLLFAVGLYETMLYWSESVVEPVVVGAVTMMGCNSEEEEVKKRRRWVVERLGLGLSFGALWWWRLRDNVDSLAALPAADTDQLVVMKVADFISLGLYYLTLSTGAVRGVTGFARTMQLMIRTSSSKNTPAPAPRITENV